MLRVTPAHFMTILTILYAVFRSKQWTKAGMEHVVGFLKN